AEVSADGGMEIGEQGAGEGDEVVVGGEAADVVERGGHEATILPCWALLRALRYAGRPNGTLGQQIQSRGMAGVEQDIGTEVAAPEWTAKQRRILRTAR